MVVEIKKETRGSVDKKIADRRGELALINTFLATTRLAEIAYQIPAARMHYLTSEVMTKSFQRPDTYNPDADLFIFRGKTKINEIRRILSGYQMYDRRKTKLKGGV